MCVLNGVFSLLFRFLSKKNVSGNGNSVFGGFPIYSRGVPDLQSWKAAPNCALIY